MTKKPQNTKTSKTSKQWLKRHFDDPYVKKSWESKYRSRASFKLIEILEKGSKDTKPIEYHALELKRILGIRHPEFLEFVVAVLYRLAMVDHIVSIEEERDIRKVADVFNIKKTFTDKAVGFLTEE